MKKTFLILFLPALFGLRFFLAEKAYQHQQAVFPYPQKGLFRVYVCEEPQLLFGHAQGSHDTGRAGGSYQPFVKEVRAVCTLVGMFGPGPGRTVPPQKQPHPHLPLRSRGFEGQAGLLPSRREKGDLPPSPPRGGDRGEGDVSNPHHPSPGALAQRDNDGYRKLPPMKVRCTFRLSPGAPQAVLSYGDLVEIEGKIQAPRPALNPGQFDYAHYLKTKGVAYVMYVSPGQWRKSGGPGAFSPARSDPAAAREGPQGFFLLKWAFALKRHAEDTLYRFLPYPENALLDGLILGERASLPEDMVESFFLTGTIHILAVSGLITAFIAGLCFMVLRVLQLGRKTAAGLSLVALLFFVLMTGANPPVCRAGLFSALALLAVLFERRIHGGRLLLATALVLVFLNPFVLQDLSFQISFLATAGLMVTASRMMEKLSFLWRPAALVAASTTAAQLAVGCLILYDFNQAAVYSVPANLMIVPLSLLATAGGLTLLAGACLHPALGTLFGAACEVPLRLLAFLAGLLARLPKADWVVASPSLAWVLAFHALLLASFYFFWPGSVPEQPSVNWKRRETFLEKGRRGVRRAWMLFIAATLCAGLAQGLRTRPLRVVFLAVGHGNAVVLESPKGKVLVVDGGKATQGPDRYNPMVAYLRHIGVQRVEGILSTHPDEDHAGGLVNLVSAYPVSEAYGGRGAQSDSESYGKLKALLQAGGTSLSGLEEGDQVRSFPGVGIAVLHPPASYVPRRNGANNLSMVSLVSYGGFHLILPGDLEKEGLLRLLKDNRPFPKVDWLLAPHHGRSTGEPALCAKGLRPRFVVLSDWRDYPKARAAYQAAVPEAVVLSTAKEGAVELELYADGHGRYRTFREEKWRNFQAGSLDKSFTGSY